MIKKILVLIFISYSVISNGQFGYYQDALRFSRSNYSLGSTARMQAIGGAQVSLGGDISSAISNPAGLGFFNKSVFVLSPSMDFGTINSDYFLSSSPDSRSSEETFKNNFNFANIGTVINFGKGRFTNDKFKGGSLAITLNRAQSFHLNRSYEGENNFNSVADALAQNAGVTDPGFFENAFDEVGSVEFYDQAAYLGYLISPSFSGNDVTGYFADFDGFPIQNENIEERGSHYQMNIAWGGNYDDRLYFGGGMGVQLLNYRQQRTYTESEFAVFDNDGNFVGEDTRLNSIFIFDDLSVRGVGVNFNAGVIFRPLPFMTVGASYTSPSFMTLDEESFFDFDVDWKPGASFITTDDTIDLNQENTTFPSALFVNNYNLRTPSRVALGTSLFIGKSGFLTGDIEFVDYSNANIHSQDFSPTSDNDAIRDSYESVMNIRVGGEYRFDNFRLRAGYAILPSPFKDSDLDEQTNITFGFGYRTPDYFLDFAVVNSSRTINYVPYEIADNQPTISSDIENTVATITFGLNF